jgi:predicted O-linked N-acetylglucosamine transferase (SPINDLY family)
MGIFDRLRSAGQAADHGKNPADTSVQDETRLIDEGHALEAAGRLDEAMQRYLDAIRLAPNPARAHLNRGNVLLLKGDLQGALDAFRTAIKHKPDYAGAYYNIGNALLGNGQYGEAVASYRRALEIQPDYAEVHCSLGVALKELGKLDDAVASFQRALKINPGLVEAHNNLGNVLQDRFNTGNLQLNTGKLHDAVANFRLALEIEPNLAEAHFNLGSALNELGQLEGAAASYRRALEIKPDFAEAHNNLGLALKDIGQLDEAIACYRRASEIKPDLAEAHNNLGSTLKDIGQLDNAVACYRRALEFKPDFVEAQNNLGIALQSLGHLDSAIACYRSALEIKPNYAEAHSNLGIALQELGQLEAAAANFRLALKFKPDFVEALSNLGIVLHDLGQLDEAVKSYRRALEIKPDYAKAHSNLGSALKDLMQMDEAMASYRRALEIKPDYAEAFSNLLFCLNHSETSDPQTLFAEHLRFAERFEAPFRDNWPQHGNSRDPERCLQIGFVSGDLCSHAVANFFELVITHLAGRPQLSLHAYYNNFVEDSVTQRLRGYLPHWHNVVSLSDEALAQQIRKDGIDILFDLSGHTAKHRLLAFARKPAPLQVSWIGYPGTTGLSAMDYYQSDRFLFPDNRFDNQFTEKIVRLPASSAFLPSKDAPPVNPLPALINGHLTFGSFNRPSKISRTIVALWAQLLRALPDSRMLLGAMPQEGKYLKLIEWFEQEGIARSRLDFHGRCNMEHYLGLHHQVDICLDTFPYNGGTTTFHALWMGVPTLTLAGHTMAGWAGASIMGHVGLETEFAAVDAADFVRKGSIWADNLAALSDIRSGLRVRFAKSARGQPAVVAASMERALRVMWQRWCAGLPAESFEVSDINSKLPGFTSNNQIISWRQT